MAKLIGSVINGWSFTAGTICSLLITQIKALLSVATGNQSERWVLFFVFVCVCINIQNGGVKAQKWLPQPHVYLGCPGNSRVNKASRVILESSDADAGWMKQKWGGIFFFLYFFCSTRSCRKPYMSATLYPALSATLFLNTLSDGKTIKYQRLHFLLSVQSHSGLADFWESVVLFVFSAQADDRVRLETRDSAHFDFASAMNAVTEFYCHSQEKGVFLGRCVASSPLSALYSYHILIKSHSNPSQTT